MKRPAIASFGALALVILFSEFAPFSAFAQGQRGQAFTPANGVEDEYARYELLAPATSSFRITYDVSVVTPGATSYSDVVPVGSQASDVSAIDLMTGAPLPFQQSAARIDITLARPVPKGGQARIRILKTLKDVASYRQLGPDLLFEHPSSIRRAAVVLPENFELIGADVPVQVIQEPDGRIVASYMRMHRFTGVVSIRARALKTLRANVQRGDGPSEPRPSQAPPDAPPAAQPMDQIRVTERAVQDREI